MKIHVGCKLFVVSMFCCVFFDAWGMVVVEYSAEKKERMIRATQAILCGAAYGDAIGAIPEFQERSDFHKQFPKGLPSLSQLATTEYVPVMTGGLNRNILDRELATWADRWVAFGMITDDEQDAERVPTTDDTDMSILLFYGFLGDMVDFDDLRFGVRKSADLTESLDIKLQRVALNFIRNAGWDQKQGWATWHKLPGCSSTQATSGIMNGGYRKYEAAEEKRVAEEGKDAKGKPVDIGLWWLEHANPAAILDYGGNGSAMKAHVCGLAFLLNLKKALESAHLQSIMLQGHPGARAAACAVAGAVVLAFHEKSLPIITQRIYQIANYYHEYTGREVCKAYALSRIGKKLLAACKETDIIAILKDKENSYTKFHYRVFDDTIGWHAKSGWQVLAAAVYILNVYRNDSAREAILLGVHTNKGDTDTLSSIVGGIANARHGLDDSDLEGCGKLQHYEVLMKAGPDLAEHAIANADPEFDTLIDDIKYSKELQKELEHYVHNERTFIIDENEIVRKQYPTVRRRDIPDDTNYNLDQIITSYGLTSEDLYSNEESSQKNERGNAEHTGGLKKDVVLNILDEVQREIDGKTKKNKNEDTKEPASGIDAKPGSENEVQHAARYPESKELHTGDISDQNKEKMDNKEAGGKRKFLARIFHK
jgi:ADP-ribosylglycohydrolase